MINTLKSALLFTCVALYGISNPIFAQTQPALALNLFAGVNVTGEIGSIYVIQSSTNPTEINSWTSLAFLRLPATNYLFVDTTSTATHGNKFYRALLQMPPSKMVFIPPNTFNLGSPTNEAGRMPDEGPQTAVTITRGFWMGKFEVTQREYLAVVGNNPSQFPDDLSRPVETVSWIDSTNYCVKLTQQELVAGRIPAGSRYRLPTEAEWEYAARAGTSTRFSYGDDPDFTSLTNYAWFSENSGSNGPHPVGQKPPNAWGLYDMEGNVREWCLDWYVPYSGGFAIDPQGPDGNALGIKITRGGAWDISAGDCRSARREFEAVSPFITDFDLGFRVILSTP